MHAKRMFKNIYNKRRKKKRERESRGKEKDTRRNTPIAITMR